MAKGSVGRAAEEEDVAEEDVEEEDVVEEEVAEAETSWGNVILILLIEV